MGFDWSRPSAMGLDLSSNRLPWSAPWMTNKEATEYPLLGSGRRRKGSSFCNQANRPRDDRQPVTHGRAEGGPGGPRAGRRGAVRGTGSDSLRRRLPLLRRLERQVEGRGQVHVPRRQGEVPLDPRDLAAL